MYTIISAMAEFERDRIRERVHLGLERARREGKTLGRPPTLPTTEIRKRRKRGVPAAKIARSSVYRVCEDESAESR